MKKLFYTICIFLAIVINFFFIPGQYIGNNPLVGLWEGEINQKNIKLNFNQDKAFSFIIADKISSEVIEYSGNYAYQLNKLPCALTLRDIKGIDHPLHSAFSIVNADSIRLSFFSDRMRTRPIMISQENSFGLRLVYNN